MVRALAATGRFRVILAALAALGGAVTVAAASPVGNERIGFAALLPERDRPSFVPGELLVRFKPGVDGKRRAALRREHGAPIERNLVLPRTQLLTLEPGASVEEAAAAFEREPEVAYAEPNFYRHIDGVPNDPDFGKQWGLHDKGNQRVNNVVGKRDADIDAPEAWETTTGERDVTIAVVDSGIAYNHGDLNANIWHNPEEGLDGNDNDGNGEIDDVMGWDFIGDDNDPNDPNGHGTHMAAIIGAAGGNGSGISGVSRKVSLMPLRALNVEGTGNVANATSAYLYAADKGAKVVNFSASSAVFSQTELDTINALPDTLFVVSAGNNGTDNDIAPRYPCNYRGDHGATNVVCVASTDQQDQLVSDSNYGARTVDLAAPGNNIWSAVSENSSNAYGPQGFETDLGGWTTGGINNTWARAMETPGGGMWSLTDSPGGDYANDTNSWAQSPAIDLTGKRSCWVDYWAVVLVAPGDVLYLEASTTAGENSWKTLASFPGLSLGTKQSDLPGSFDDQATVYLRFRLYTNNSGVNNGAFIDDVRLKCLDGTFPAPPFEFESGTSQATAHVSGVAALLWADDPNRSVADAVSAIWGGVDCKTASGGKTTWICPGQVGRLNAAKALNPPLNPFESFAGDLSIYAQLPATGPDAAIRCRGTFTKNVDDTMANRIFCLFDRPQLTVNPPAIPAPYTGAVTCSATPTPPLIAPLAYCGDGLTGAPPPANWTAGTPANGLFGDVDGSHVQIAGEYHPYQLAHASERQMVKLTDAGASGGGFGLTAFDPSGSNPQTTAFIAYDATAATVQQELEALSNVGAGNVQVSGPAGGPWTVEFILNLGNDNVDQLSADGFILPAGDVVVTTIREGQGQEGEVHLSGCYSGIDNAAVGPNAYLKGTYPIDEGQATWEGTVDVWLVQPTCNDPDPDGDGVPPPTLDDEVLEVAPRKSIAGVLAQNQYDSDKDGCSDTQELRNVSASGGLRDPYNGWDFTDEYTGLALTRDRAVTGGDIVAVVARFGTNGDRYGDPNTAPIGANSYHVSADRSGSLPGSNAWNLKPPDGAIAGGDIGAVVIQFGHTCTL